MSQNLAIGPVAAPVTAALAAAASTATMQLAAIPSRADARKANAAAKRAAKGIAKHGLAKPAVGEVASAQERAEIISQAGDGTGGNAAEIAAKLEAMDAATKGNVDLNDPNQATPAERKLLLTTAKMIAVGVGLGSAKCEHAYGPMVRTVLSKLIATIINKRVPGRDDFTPEHLEQVLTMPTFQAMAVSTLDLHLVAMSNGDAKKIAQTGVGPADSTVAARKKNADLARKWIISGMHVGYLEALRIIHRNGKRVQFGEGNKMIDLPLADALATAFGRNLTAGELYRREKAVVTAHAEATAVKQTAAATTPVVIAPVVAGAFDVPTPVAAPVTA